MKPSIHKKTQKYLAELNGKDEAVNLYNSKDPIDILIYGKELRIKALHFHPDLDLMLIVLSNKKVLARNISSFQLLQKATINQLEAYELIGNGIGIHWPELDEDLSLKGFLIQELNRVVDTATL